MINMQLANKLGLSNSTIHEIIFWQTYRKSLNHQYARKEISASTYVELWEQNEYRLQELWGFPKDPNYHRFWEMAGCTCPKMDNRDSWGTMFHYYNYDCPIHGAKN